MSQPDGQRHSFIVSIWLEETIEEAAQPLWRGEITHVPGGERRSIHNLDQILVFIAPYLLQMGVAPQRRRWRWL